METHLQPHPSVCTMEVFPSIFASARTIAATVGDSGRDGDGGMSSSHALCGGHLQQSAGSRGLPPLQSIELPLFFRDGEIVSPNFDLVSSLPILASD